jgi:hypothetical protein
VLHHVDAGDRAPTINDTTDGNQEMTEPMLQSMLREIDYTELNPVDREIREARRRAEGLIREIHSGSEPIFRVKEFQHHGSLSRGTGLRGFEDWDSIIILDEDALKTQRGTPRGPISTIALLAETISNRRSGLMGLQNLEVRRQDHSVGVVYPKSAFRVDLVPGLRQRGELLIPERGTGEWIPTHPDEAHERVRHACEIEPDTISAIRLLKSWSRARGNGSALPSFAIETYVVDLMLRDARSLDEVVFDFIETIAAAPIRRPLVLGDNNGDEHSPVTIIDPLSGNNLTSELTATQRSTLIKTARATSRKLNSVRGSLERGKSSDAKRVLRQLFVRRSQ